MEILSIVTALCYGLNAVLTRKGMKNSNPLTGALIAALIQLVILAGMLITSPPKRLDWVAITYFVISGILASTLGRLFNYMSINRLGVPVSSSIIGSTPLFSALFAIILISERVATSTLVGTFLVVLGIALTSGGDKTFSLKSSAIVLPLLSAACYGASAAVRKAGLIILPDSTLGAVVGAFSSLVSFSAYVVASRRVVDLRFNGRSLAFFSASGVVISVAWVTMFNALAVGKVSVVATLSGTYPLFAIILSWLMLRETDELSLMLVIGCISIVLGAAIITFY